MPIKYVVISELDTGYMACVAICDNANEAYGEAYLALVDGLDTKGYYVTLPEYREGENGYIMELVEKGSGNIVEWVTVLFYKPESNGAKMEVES